ncbi:hypothetical protein T08_3729 [Trichinella sp. T8]|nr:hypothetical protein T08_3729 [Trichinella sp. T8]
MNLTTYPSCLRIWVILKKKLIKVMQVRNKRVCHDFWLCDVMDPKVENPVGFFSVNVVIKLCKTLPKDKGLRSYPVMAFNELKRRRRGANDFYRTNDNKVCVVKWFDNSENGIATRDVMDLMEFMLSVSESLIKLEKLYIKRKRGRPEAQRTAEKEPGPSGSV